MALIVQKLIVGLLQTNCYLISCEISGHTFVIDPGDSPKRIINYIRRNEFIPKGILLTHGHPDHTGGTKILRNELGAPVMIHPKDSQMLPLIGIETADKYLVHGEFLDLGRIRFLVIHTPGHTPGSICIYFSGQDILFSGDTLFKGGVGRTDLPGGEAKQLEDSLRNRVLTLPLDTQVYPGHGPETVISKERQECRY